MYKKYYGTNTIQKNITGIIIKNKFNVQNNTFTKISIRDFDGQIKFILWNTQQYIEFIQFYTVNSFMGSIN